MIKRIFLLFTILLSISAFSQTKKKKTVKKQTKEVTKVEPKSEGKISTVKQYIGDNDATIEPPKGEMDQEIDDNAIYNTAGIEVKPEFPGGTEKFNSFMSRNIKLTNEMKESEIKGKVFASFVIEKDGTISNIKIIRDIGYGMANEVIRVLKSMPRWIPGEQNGKKVRCSYMVPIMIYATKQE
ncbi:energy transducer TonB [Flavobacterium sp.]|uniref:energy transducer TonB n=1 Tax=Flavobacterium sp. TaxID=239 RepID=UPI0037507606